MFSKSIYLGPTIKSFRLLNKNKIGANWMNGIIRTEYVHMEMVKKQYGRNTDTDEIRIRLEYVHMGA